jgi:phosphate-selective porin OprO and OprP
MKKIIVLLFALLSVSFILAETSTGSLGWDERGYLVMQSDDGNFKLRFDTRIYINGSYFLDDPEEILSNQTNLRKARFAIKTQLWKYWAFEWDIDIAEGDIVEVKDMWVSFSGFKNAQLKFGNFKQPFGLEEITSSRLLTFPERAMVMLAFETDRQFGLEYSKWGALGKIPFNLRTSIYTQTLSNEAKSDFEKEIDETGTGAALRFVVAPKINDDLLFHGGFAFVYDTPYDDSETMDFKSEAETKNGDLEWLDTDKIKEVDHALRYGLEGIVQYKNFHFQTEYVMVNVIRLEDSTAGDATFDGGYASLSWTLTGERRPWSMNDGEFGQIMPKNKKTGAWELAARYSYLSLTDEDAESSSGSGRAILGGGAIITTLGLNWYANPNVKFQLAYSMVDLNVNANSEGDYIYWDEDDNTLNRYPDGYDFNYLQFMTILYF